MGCTSSKRESGELNPRIFKVFNVDDQRHELNPGKIEITEHDLILTQRGKETIRWPLRSLRRYGFDEELFSFESGRRCPTGPGIYAFKCRRAEDLFNLMQDCIQRAGQEDQHNGVVENGHHDTHHQFLNNNGNILPNRHHHFPITNNNQVHNYVNGATVPSLPVTDPHEYVNTGQYTMTNHVNNRTTQPIVDPSSVLVVDMVSVQNQRNTTRVLNYASLDLPPTNENIVSSEQLSEGRRSSDSGSYRSGVDSSSQPTYINMVGENGRSIVNRRLSLTRQGSNEQHNYANVDLIANTAWNRQVNYIQLDLEHNSNLDNVSFGSTMVPPPASPVSLTPSVTDSPNRRMIISGTDSYAMIDFHKTRALTNSAKTVPVEDEGCRKTRHNSTVDELG